MILCEHLQLELLPLYLVLESAAEILDAIQ